MLKMENVGRKIAELRRKNNMTQLELADRMGISFQAVSNWERGISMPDVLKLPELAELFSVTVDELLGGKSEIVKNIVNGEFREYLKTNAIIPEELSEIAPLLKPTQFDEAFKNIKVTSLREIEGLLPFISRETADELLIKTAERRVEELAVIAPFASRDTIDGIAALLYEKSGLQALPLIAPFMSEKQIVQIAKKECANNGFQNMPVLAPFLDRVCWDELARK